MSYASEAGHWYAKDGTPAYLTIGKNGLPRKTTLRDARIHGHRPGVSDIIKCAAAEALENWKDDRLLEAAEGNPRRQDEDFKSYCKRVKAAQREEAAKAPDLGTVIHGCIEKYLINKQEDVEFQKHVDGAVNALAKWCDGLDGISAEKSFAHPLGFGGKVDIHKPAYVADFKTKEFDESNLPLTWDNHAMQLGAYREGLGMPQAWCCIIYVSTSVPGLVHLVEIPNDELERGWRMFRSLLAYWQEKNRYKPEGGLRYA